MTTNNGKVTSVLVNSSWKATGNHAGSKPGVIGIHAGSNGRAIGDRASSKPGVIGIHAGSNGRAIGDRVNSRPGAIGTHAASNILATGVRCGGSRAIDARVGRTHGVSAITDSLVERANAFGDKWFVSHRG
jgi:hypothetical protein